MRTDDWEPLNADESPGGDQPVDPWAGPAPPHSRRSTLDAARVGLVIAAVAVVCAVAWWWTGRPEDPTAIPAPLPLAGGPSPSPGLTSPAASPGTAATTTGDVLVDVRGAVRHPGVRRLPAGARVVDAVAAAGGLRPGRGYGAINLAQVLVDGQQLHVGAAASPGAPGGAPTTGAPGATGVAGAVNLNTATAVDLEALDGIGPVLAAAIVQWRTDNGSFHSVDDLLSVSGIGEATLAGIRDHVSVG